MKSDIFIPFPFSPEIKPGKQGPFFEIRTYTYMGGELPVIQKTWEAALPGRLKFGPIVACGYTELGALSKFIHIWPYQSLDGRWRIRNGIRTTGNWPPAALADGPVSRTLWLEGYVDTYVQRDLRQLAQVGDLSAFLRLVRLAALRNGGLLNHADLGRDAGLPRTTVQRWLSILEASFLVTLLPPFAETKVADFDRMVATNLRSAFLVTRAFLPAILERRRGDIFFMSSIAGLGAYPNAAAYCAAKFGVTGLAKVLRAETKKTGVRVCCVHPGATWSPSWSGSGVPEERIMPTKDVARAFLDVWRLSRRTVVEEIVLRPQLGDVG
jgi:NAD(P)-dependent dehydrogenase (short-subunit alcohol dehydrogenase family)